MDTSQSHSIETHNTNPPSPLHTIRNETLSQLPENLAVPSYDRGALTQGIVHIGVGNFHRAHQALYLDDLFQKGLGTDWAICGVGLQPNDQTMRDALASQDGLYTLVECDSTQSDQARVIGSITQYLWAPENPQAVLEKLASPEIRLVTLTVTEGGYYTNDVTGELLVEHPAIQHDLEHPTLPHSVYGYLVEALYRRRQYGVLPFTVLSCDNLPHNGDIVRKMLLSFAQQRDSDLAQWIATHGAFPNCMVDRITPRTTETERNSLRTQWHINDACPVFAEPFRQWVVEDHFCNGRPPWEEVGVQMTSDVVPYEIMKLRLLNAGHSSLAYLAALAGFEYVDEAIQENQFREFIRKLMDEEITPVLPPIPDVDLEAYKQTLLQRFSNTRVRDTIARLCIDGSSKFPKFLLPTLSQQLEGPGNIRCLSLVLASWFRYLEGTDEQGNSFDIIDPQAEMLRDHVQKCGRNPEALLQLPQIFGDTLSQSALLIQHLHEALTSLQALGSQQTVARY